MDLYVFRVSKFNNGQCELKSVRSASGVMVMFDDDTSEYKSQIKEVDKWIELKEGEEPDCEVIALGYQEEMIIGFISGNECEGDGSVLTDVTHWRPKPFTKYQVNSVLGKGIKLK